MNYSTKVLLLSGLFLIAGTLRSQHPAAGLTGQINDSEKAPVEAALVWLVLPETNACVAQAVTDSAGRFVLPCTGRTVRLAVTCLGYTPYQSEPFEGGRPHDFGTIVLGDTQVQLDAVVVTGEKRRPLVEQKAGKLVFHVENSITAQGSNALEVLRETPGVSIDDGNKAIGLNGRGGVMVMLNGKQTYMQQSEVMDLLKSTPSSNIRTIEVMTNATAQYDAAGSGGILNIVMKKERQAGYNLTVNAGVSYWLHPKQNTELAFNYNRNKLSIYGNYSHQFGYTGLFYGGTRKQSGKLFESHSDDTDKRNTAAVLAGVEYAVTPEHRIGTALSGNFLFGPGLIRTWNTIYDSYEGGAPLYGIYSESDYYHQTADRYNANVNYAYESSDKRRLAFDLDYSRFRGDSKNRQPNTYYSPSMQPDSALDYRSSGIRDIRLYALTGHYNQALWGGEAAGGVKYSNVASENGYGLYEVNDGQTVTDLEASNDFRFVESILAAYILYDFSWKDTWQFNIGCRLEYTHSDGHLMPLPGSPNEESHVKRAYTDLFPSAGITYKLGKGHIFSVSYGKRIDRPVYSDLNPIEQPLDGLSSWKGNPFLKPQKTHRIGLQYQYRNTSVEASYARTTDYRVGITDTLGTDKTVMLPLNLGTQQYYGLAVNQGLRLFHACDVACSARVYQLDNQMAFDESRSYRRKRWACGFSVRTSFPLVWGIRSEVLGIYSSKRLGGSTDVLGANGLANIGFRKNFLQGKASVSLTFSDIFLSSNWDAVNRFDGFEAVGYGYGESRLVKLNVSFKFGRSPKNNARKSAVEQEIDRF